MKDEFCMRTAPIWQLLGYALYALKIIIPLLVIIFGIIGFARAIMGDEKGLISAAIGFGKKIILAICIFFVPTFVSVVMTIVGVKLNSQECQTCLLKPNSADCIDAKAKAKALLNN